MLNKINDGKLMPYANTGTTTIEAGTPVIVQDIVGVAVDDIPAGETGTLLIDGVVSSTAATGAWLQGEDIYLTSAGVLTTATTGNTLAGVAWAAKGTNDTTGYVLLNRHS